MDSKCSRRGATTSLLCRIKSVLAMTLGIENDDLLDSWEKIRIYFGKDGILRFGTRITHKTQALLASIGAKMGLRIWLPKVDRSAVCAEWNDHRDALLDVLRLNYDETTLKTIEQIDVLWLRGRAIVRAFEVEHTRRFTRASCAWLTYWHFNPIWTSSCILSRRMSDARRSSRKYAVRCFRCWRRGRSPKAVPFCRMIICANWPNRNTSHTYRITFSTNMPRMPSKQGWEAAEQGLAADGAPRPQDHRFFKGWNRPTPVPIYRCAAAEAQTVGQRYYNRYAINHANLYTKEESTSKASILQPHSVEHGNIWADSSHTFLFCTCSAPLVIKQ